MTTMRERQDGACKGCGDQYRVTSADIDRMLTAPIFRSEDACVPDDVYRRRLAACRGCSKLTDGETCAACGCYVRVAAKLRAKRCPLPGGGLWPAEA